MRATRRAGAALIGIMTAVLATVLVLVGTPAARAAVSPTTVGIVATPDGGGYWIVTSDGSVDPFGDATAHGSLHGVPITSPVVGMAATSTGAGYWLVTASGGVFGYGDAGFYGSVAAGAFTSPVVAITRTSTAAGYWILASDGQVLPFGDATALGSLPAGSPPAVALTATPSGAGYWITTSDGGVTPFGDATSYGSLSSVKLAQPAVALAATPTGSGYWMVLADGNVFAFGDASFFGGAAGTPHASPVVAVAPRSSGKGYWLATADGEVFAFGDATADNGLPTAPTGLVATPGTARVTLSWTAPADNGGTPVTGYEVYEATAAGAEVDTATPACSITTTACTAGDLTNGTPYYFVVEAINSTGASAPSTEVSATPAVTPTLRLDDGRTVAAAGSHHLVVGVAEPGSTVTLYRGSTAVGSATATDSGQFRFAQTLRSTAHYVATSAGQHSPALAIHVTPLTLRLDQKKLVVADSSTHTLAGTAPRGLEVQLVVGRRTVAMTRADSHNRYHFKRVFTATHKYRVKCDGVRSAALTVTVKSR